MARLKEMVGCPDNRLGTPQRGASADASEVIDKSLSSQTFCLVPPLCDCATSLIEYMLCYAALE